MTSEKKFSPVTLDNSTWASNPGVVSGCEVFIHDGLYIGVKPGRLSFLNGYSAEILETMYKVARLQATDTGRTDYVVARARNKSLYFHCMAGEKLPDTWDHFPVAMKDGVLLAKLVVSGPLVSASSVTVYNVFPVSGESQIIGCRPLTAPDGINRKFMFPFQVNTGYAMDLRIYGIPQSEYADYTVSNELQPGGNILTAVTFLDEAPPIGADIIARLYLGKVKI
jgi:hypothetical protein